MASNSNDIDSQELEFKQKYEGSDDSDSNDYLAENENNKENLLYDENLDDIDELWHQKSVKEYNTLVQNEDSHSTDAVLSCAMCWTTVCYDCQAHIKFKNQFRAMFAKNVRVDTSKVFTYKKGKLVETDPILITHEMEAGADIASLLSPNLFFPVHCEYCENQLGMYDHDELFHFFNVISSPP